MGRYLDKLKHYHVYIFFCVAPPAASPPGFLLLTRRVSDEVFEERFLGICHNTEDFVTAAKSTGLGNTRKLSKWKVFEVLNERDFVFSIQHVKLEMTRR